MNKIIHQLYCFLLSYDVKTPTIKVVNGSFEYYLYNTYLERENSSDEQTLQEYFNGLNE